jgi:hypothetical protein
MQKSISPDALIALEEALSAIYWVKKDLRHFIECSIENRAVLFDIDWSSITKREIVATLINRMEKRQDIYQEDLLRLIYHVSNMSDFSHLKKWENSDDLIKNAKNSVAVLRNHCSSYFDLQAEKEMQEQRRQAHIASINEKQGFSNKLSAIKKQFENMSQSGNAQARGYEFEQLLNDLFSLYDLQPKKSFKILGEQIDGAFTFEGTEYLLEAKWQSKLSDNAELYTFEGKIERKLKTTLGLFVSYSGFSSEVIESKTQSKSIILMDGMDLVRVLEGQIALQDMLLLKRQHAALTGEAMYRVPY